MKRGQITYFIIASLIILIAVILILFAKSEFIKSLYEEQRTKLIGVPADIKPVEDYIQECIDLSAPITKDIIALQGGYAYPNESVDTTIAKVAYWYNKEDISPSLNIIKNQMSIYFKDIVENCIKGFNDTNYIINIKSFNSKFDIKKDEILVTANIPIEVNYKNTIFKLNKFNTKFKSDFLDVYEAAKIIVLSEKENPDLIDVTLLSNLGFDVNYFEFNDGLVYVVSGDDTDVYFANRF